MDFLLTSIGSHGDIHPFIGMGLALKRRGHRVTLLINGYFESLVRKVGLEFLPLGTAQQFMEVAADPEVWNGARGTVALLRFLAQSINPQYEAVRDHVVAGQTIVVGSSLALGARVAQDHLKFPMVTVHLSPAVFRSHIDPPKFAGVPRWMPRPLVQMMYGLADRFIVDPALAPAVNALRNDLHLPPVTGVLSDWMHSPDLVIGLFPEWFAPPAADWPAQTKLTGFPMWDEREVNGLSPDIHDWLNDDNPPLVFTPGSAMIHGKEFFETAVDACLRTHRRGLFLTRHREQIPRNLPDLIKYAEYAPFSQLLPRVAAIVHHGGIGTCAQGLAAGIRQIIMPMAHDQLDNAARLQKLGVAEVLPPRKFTAKRLANLISMMFEDRNYYVRCHWVSEWFHKENSLSHTAAMLEQFGKSRVQPSTSAAEITQ